MLSFVELKYNLFTPYLYNLKRTIDHFKKPVL